MRFLITLVSLICILHSCRFGMELENEEDLSSLVKSNPQQAIGHIDSLLRKQSKKTLPASQQIKLRQLRQESFAILANTDSIFEDALMIQALARRVNDSMAYARALLPLRGTLEESKFKYLEDAYPLAIGIFSRRKLYREQAMLMSVEAAMLNNLGNYEASQRLALEAISLPGIFKRDTLMAFLYQTIANNFFGESAYDRSMDYYRKALKIADELEDSLLRSNIHLDLGILHYNMDTDSARYFYQEALNILPAVTGKLPRIKILYNLAVQDFEADRNADALAGFRYLLDVSRHEGIPTGEAVAYKALGFYHEAKGNPDSAVFFLERSIRLSDSIGQPFLKIQGLIELAKAYRTAGKEEKAFALHLETDEIRDSMFGVDKKNVIHGLEMRFDTERIALENENLRKDLYIRKGWILFLILFSIASVALVWLARQRSRLWKTRANSYAVLMEKYKAERIAAQLSLQQQAPPSEISMSPVISSNKSVTNQIVSNPTYVDLQHLFLVKAVHRNPKLRIEDVAQWLNVSPKHISSVLKDRESLTFTQYVNSHRIRDARRIMEDPETASYKLESIGEMVGIPNRSYFQRLFESIVGVPPGHYRRNILREGLAEDQHSED